MGKRRYQGDFRGIQYEWISPDATKICTKLENCNFANAVVFHPIINFFCAYYSGVKEPNIKFQSKNQFCKLVKNYPQIFITG